MTLSRSSGFPDGLDWAFPPCVSGPDGLAMAIYVRAYMHGECFWQIELEASSDPMELGSSDANLNIATIRPVSAWR